MLKQPVMDLRASRYPTFALVAVLQFVPYDEIFLIGHRASEVYAIRPHGNDSQALFDPPLQATIKVLCTSTPQQTG